MYKERRKFMAGMAVLGAFGMVDQGWAQAPVREENTGDKWSHNRGPLCNVPSWTAYRDRFIAKDGGVPDSSQGFIHSESIGFSAWLATRNNDIDSWRRVTGFAEKNLEREDGLHAWSWFDGIVLDKNNATDGDIFIAWSHLEAFDRWGEGDPKRYINALKSMLVTDQGETLILPGSEGFFREDGQVTLNPSYWVYPAFRAFERFDRDRVWRELFNSGMKISERSVAGQWKALPDWILWPTLAPWKERSLVSGFDAMRTPLYASWAGADTRFGKNMVTGWANTGRATLPIDGGSIESQPMMNLSHTDIARFVSHAGNFSVEESMLAKAWCGGDYYETVLRLMVMEARKDRGLS